MSRRVSVDGDVRERFRARVPVGGITGARLRVILAAVHQHGAQAGLAGGIEFGHHVGQEQDRSGRGSEPFGDGAVAVRIQENLQKDDRAEARAITAMHKRGQIQAQRFHLASVMRQHLGVRPAASAMPGFGRDVRLHLRQPGAEFVRRVAGRGAGGIVMIAPDRARLFQHPEGAAFQRQANGEIDIFGVFVPAILVLMLVAYLINLVIRTVLARAGFYRLVWHRSIFDLGIYVLVLGLVVIVSHRFIT